MGTMVRGSKDAFSARHRTEALPDCQRVTMRGRTAGNQDMTISGSIQS